MNGSLRILLPALLLLALGWPASNGQTRAENAPGRTGEGWFDPAGFMKALRTRVQDGRKPEALAMAQLLVTKGIQMGPTDGWFRPGQSRYGWSWLAARHSLGKEPGIDAKSFRGPTELFQRLDRNRDGLLTPDDFDWSEYS